MQKMCKNLLILIIIVVNCIGMMAWFGEGASNAEISNNVKIKDTLEVIKEKRVLTVASANDIPFFYIDTQTKKITGIDADILTEISKRLGINKIEMKEISFSNILEI